ncbi:MAG: exo-alpha-sialidase [Microbacterium sp.]|nr:exo-alpha-sialidase [Microbacterium sp.]
MPTRRQFLGLAAAGAGGLLVAQGIAPQRAAALGLFEDVGIIESAECATPGIIATGGPTLSIATSRRYPNSVPGGNIETGPADIITFRSTDDGATWEPARMVHDAYAGSPADSGAAPVLVMIDGQLAVFYMVGPENWTIASRVPHLRFSPDSGDTWGPVTTPTITSAHIHGQPTNGGKGFAFPNGRIVVPGRGCLLYSDDDGVSWTATPQFTGPGPNGQPSVETKTQPYFINGAISKTALVPWRNNNRDLGEQERVRIADDYADNGTVTSATGGAINNFGLVRYDAQTLLMSYTLRSALDVPSPLFVRMSADEGRHWTAGKQIPRAAGATTRYSDIAVTDNGTIVVVYMENYTTATNGNPLGVVRFDMDWLTS